MSKLDRYQIRNTISGEIAIVELEKNQEVEGLSFFKDKSGDKSNDAVLAVMKFLEGMINEGENSVTVESSFGELTYVLKEESR